MSSSSNINPSQPEPLYRKDWAEKAEQVRLWSLWAKAGAVGNADVVHGKLAGAKRIVSHWRPFLRRELCGGCCGSLCAHVSEQTWVIPALRSIIRWANLLKALERLKQNTDPSVVAQATLAEWLFLDVESSERSALQSGAEEQARELHDSTDYDRYKLLRSFGLPPSS
jgi:hypothetical protein